MRGCHISSTHFKKRFAAAQQRELRAVGFKVRVSKRARHGAKTYVVFTCGKRKNRKRF